MEYSVSQINNLLRTYPQQLKARPTLPDTDASPARKAQSPDRVSISEEGKRLLEEAETPRPT